MRDDPVVVELVALARAGDQAAWDRIVARYAPLVWGLCRRYGLKGADVDDVGAAVWLRLVERLDTLREPAALPGWLATTVRRECLQLLRSQSRFAAVEPSDAALSATSSDPDVDDWLLTEERHRVLRDAFAALPEHCRRLLRLLFADPQPSYAQISTATGTPIGAIGPTRQRCLAKLRQDARLRSVAFLEAS